MVGPHCSRPARGSKAPHAHGSPSGPLSLSLALDSPLHAAVSPWGDVQPLMLSLGCGQDPSPPSALSIPSCHATSAPSSRAPSCSGSEGLDCTSGLSSAPGSPGPWRGPSTDGTCSAPAEPQGPCSTSLPQYGPWTAFRDPVEDEVPLSRERQQRFEQLVCECAAASDAARQEPSSACPPRAPQPLQPARPSLGCVAVRAINRTGSRLAPPAPRAPAPAYPADMPLSQLVGTMSPMAEPALQAPAQPAPAPAPPQCQLQDTVAVSEQQALAPAVSWGTDVPLSQLVGSMHPGAAKEAPAAPAQQPRPPLLTSLVPELLAWLDW